MLVVMVMVMVLVALSGFGGSERVPEEMKIAEA